LDSIKNLLDKFISRNRIDKVDLGDTIKDNWEKIAGDLAKGTKPFKYDKKKLFIYAENSVIMSEITYKKRVLKARINAYFKIDAVKEIIARMRQ
jgi:hypothetical protein